MRPQCSGAQGLLLNQQCCEHKAAEVMLKDVFGSVV